MVLFLPICVCSSQFAFSRTLSHFSFRASAQKMRNTIKLNWFKHKKAPKAVHKENVRKYKAQFRCLQRTTDSGHRKLNRTSAILFCIKALGKMGQSSEAPLKKGTERKKDILHLEWGDIFHSLNTDQNSFLCVTWSFSKQTVFCFAHLYCISVITLTEFDLCIVKTDFFRTIFSLTRMYCIHIWQYLYFDCWGWLPSPTTF